MIRTKFMLFVIYTVQCILNIGINLLSLGMLVPISALSVSPHMINKFKLVHANSRTIILNLYGTAQRQLDTCG